MSEGFHVCNRSRRHCPILVMSPDPNQLVVGSIPTAGAIFQNINSVVKRFLNVLLLYYKFYKEL